MDGITGTEWAVIAGGIAAIAWVNWYFFLARPDGRRPATTPAERK